MAGLLPGTALQGARTPSSADCQWQQTPVQSSRHRQQCRHKLAQLRGKLQLCPVRPPDIGLGKEVKQQPWLESEEDDDSIPIEIQDIVGQKVMENRGDATRSGLLSAFLSAGEGLEKKIKKHHRYIDQQLLDKLQKRIRTAEFIEEDAGFIEALKLLHRRLDREVNPITTTPCDQLIAEALQRMEQEDYQGSPDQRDEILRVLAGAMGLPDPTSEDLFDTAFSVAEGQQNWTQRDDDDDDDDDGGAPAGGPFSGSDFGQLTEPDLPIVPMSEFLHEARQLRDGLQSDCEALEQAITVRTQRFAWTMTSDSAAKETRDMVQALDKRGRLRDHMSTLLELADSLVTRL